MTAITQTQITGLEVYWHKIKKSGDFVLRSDFREALGNPSKGSFHSYLKNPGKMKASQAIRVAQLLTKVLKESITPEDLIKTH